MENMETSTRRSIERGLRKFRFYIGVVFEATFRGNLLFRCPHRPTVHSAHTYERALNEFDGHARATHAARCAQSSLKSGVST